MIFANWRGFSGGTRDMVREVLKFGSMIVDALREYKHPVFIYIPPKVGPCLVSCRFSNQRPRPSMTEMLLLFRVRSVVVHGSSSTGTSIQTASSFMLILMLVVVSWSPPGSARSSSVPRIRLPLCIALIQSCRCEPTPDLPIMPRTTTRTAAGKWEQLPEWLGLM